MFDRKSYRKKYSREKRERRKQRGRCVTCGVKLTFECTTLQCEHCREKQKYQNVAKVNISKLIVEAKADTVRKMQERLMQKIFENTVGNDSFAYFLKGYIDQIAKEMLEEDQCQT